MNGTKFLIYNIILFITNIKKLRIYEIYACNMCYGLMGMYSAMITRAADDKFWKDNLKKNIFRPIFIVIYIDFTLC